MTGSIRAVIVDDERPARERMIRLLSVHPRVEIAGQAGDLNAAAETCERTRPDLVFLDIQLGNASGFDLLEKLSAAPGIIFVTAFSEHALRAFEVNALNYLLKPVSPERLASALAPLLQPAPEAAPPAVPAMKMVRQDLLALPAESGLRMVKLDAVASIEAEGNYSKVHLQNGQSALVRRSLSEWETTLPGEMFVRLDRSLMIGMHSVRQVKRESQDTALLWLAGRASALRLGRRARERLQKAMPRQQGR